MGSRKELSEGEMEDDGIIDEDTTDSLEIKPPQAQRAEKKHKKKSGKEKKHGKHHKHRKNDEARMTERYEETKYHRRERGNYVDYFQHPSRPGRHENFRDYREKRRPYPQQQQQQQQPQQRNERYERHERPHRHEKQQQQPRRPKSPDENSDKIIEDLRTRILAKKTKHDEELDERMEEKQKKRKDDEKKMHKQQVEAEDEELVARRARLLEADRQMARRKEELEARREKRRGKEKSDSPTPKKRKRDAAPETPPQEVVVMVSDHSEDESDSESDSKSEEESATDDDSQHSAENSEEIEDDEEEPPIISPLSVGELSKSERRQRSSRSHSQQSTNSSQSSRSEYHSNEEEESPRRRSSPSPIRKEGPRTPESPKDDPKNGDKNDKDEDDAEPEEELPPYFPAIQGCRSVEEFQCLNRIEEGTYGVVYRAKDKRTEEIVALKRLKMEKEKEGFPITSLREINTLLKGQHPNIVHVREIVVGTNMDKIYIVMDYVEHDLKSLMETMKHKKQVFLPGEVKCLLQQLLKAVAHLHDNWILHRDLKTSNLLLSHKGILKVGDFGLAREYGSPLKAYTPIVVTLWYRAPELLLCCKEYSIPIDMWSVGCIFAEFLTMHPLFPGKSEVDQLNRIFKDLGTPNEKIWPGYNELPAVKKMTFTEYPVSNLRKKYSEKTSELGFALLQGLLTYDPKKRFSAETALQSTYFKELPLPIDPAMFPTWPAKSELGLKKTLATSPKPPSGGREFKRLGEDIIEPAGFMLAGVTYAESRQMQMGPGFSLKF